MRAWESGLTRDFVQPRLISVMRAGRGVEVVGVLGSDCGHSSFVSSRCGVHPHPGCILLSINVRACQRHV